MGGAAATIACRKTKLATGYARQAQANRWVAAPTYHYSCCQCMLLVFGQPHAGALVSLTQQWLLPTLRAYCMLHCKEIVPQFYACPLRAASSPVCPITRRQCRCRCGKVDFTCASKCTRFRSTCRAGNQAAIITETRAHHHCWQQLGPKGTTAPSMLRAMDLLAVPA